MFGLYICAKESRLQKGCTVLPTFMLGLHVWERRDSLQAACSGCSSAAVFKLVAAQLRQQDALRTLSGSVLLGRFVSPAVGNPCATQCRLQVYPDMDDGSGCQDCASDHLGYWRYNRFASIDLLWGKAYSPDSVLMGTTQSHINSIIEAILHSEGFDVRLW